jgi:chromosome partitioning protein
MTDNNNSRSASQTGPKRRTPWNTLGGRVISLVSRKGGVGKTTSAVNLGAALALSGHNVLIVGTDPQCGVCRTLSNDPSSLASGLNDVFEGKGSLTDLAQPSALDGLFFISPNIGSLDEEELYLENMTLKADIFAAEIDRARNLYDTILIDCPPSLGPPTQAALLSSDSYLVPVQAEELCRGSVESLLDFVDTFRTRYFPNNAAAQVMPLALEGIFLTMANTQTRMGRHVAARVDEEFGQWMFESGIPRNTRLSEMALKAKPAVIYDRRSKGSRAYFDLADELVSRFLDGPEETETQGITSIEELLNTHTETASNPEIKAENTGLGGLDRFLSALGATQPVPTQIPTHEEPAAPEMVSLDDLLAEEENQAHSSSRKWDDWEQGFDADDPDSDHLLN